MALTRQTLAIVSDELTSEYGWHALLCRHASDGHVTGLPANVVMLTLVMPSATASGLPHRRVLVSHAALLKHLFRLLSALRFRRISPNLRLPARIVFAVALTRRAIPTAIFP